MKDKESLQPSPDNKKTIITRSYIGLGGLGHIAIKLGADHVYATNDLKIFDQLANHFDLIINTVSVKLDWGSYLNLLKRDCTMVLLGAPADAPELFAFPLIMSQSGDGWKNSFNR